MISLHRSMHSSQIYTPGPAMSFLTCFWLLPQNEHFSRSAPSPMRATAILPLPRRPLGRFEPVAAVHPGCRTDRPEPRRYLVRRPYPLPSAVVITHAAALAYVPRTTLHRAGA